MVEQALTAAIGTVTSVTAANANALVILYGAGASAGKAGLYSVTFTPGADAIASNMTVDLIGILNDITADALLTGNFG